MLGRFGISPVRLFGSARLETSRVVASFTEAVPRTGFEGGRIVGTPDGAGGLEAGFLGGGRLGPSDLSVMLGLTRCANFEKEPLPNGGF